MTRCKSCGSGDIYILHTQNNKYLDDIDKDWVVCRCETCRRLVPSDTSVYFYSYVDDTPDQSKKDGVSHLYLMQLRLGTTGIVREVI